MSETLLETKHKKIGFVEINPATVDDVNDDRFKNFIKILFLPKGFSVTIDFQKFSTRGNNLFFINSNQYLKINAAARESGLMIYYNRDFYCIQIHDEEVACDGLLFNNIFAIPLVEIPATHQLIFTTAFQNITAEFSHNYSSREELIRTYLKQIIIIATRLWKQQHAAHQRIPQSVDMEFFRNFSRMVEVHYREKHGLADYAELLSIAPKTLNKKLLKLNIKNPNEYIKSRILTEAKRLLTYTSMTIKEIAYNLGYDDPAYFNRLFTKKVKVTPSSFRKQFQLEEA